ncbi:MAG: hypothetical protein HY870_04310, partial [Chloroflexi bacterium]|nr:hypothetical protein [Chloroflexota bacterium]
MSTPWKRVIVIGVLLMASLCAAYVAARFLWLRDYEGLETQAARRDVYRVLDNIEDDLRQLDVAAVDYAYWDDVYRYASGENPGFIAANIAAPVLVNLRVNLLIITDAAGRVLYDAALAPNGKELIAIPPELMAELEQVTH